MHTVQVQSLLYRTSSVFVAVRQVSCFACQKLTKRNNGNYRALLLAVSVLTYSVTYLLTDRQTDATNAYASEQTRVPASFVVRARRGRERERRGGGCGWLCSWHPPAFVRGIVGSIVAELAERNRRYAGRDRDYLSTTSS